MSKNKQITRPCYTLVMDGKKAELTLYGEIVESQPVDWWTGEPIDGQFIILKVFLNDLETIKGAELLTIHLNSVGGDAYSSLAIHNRLRELARDGTETVCIVDGVAMSGGSLIMCACDTVKANPSSIVMIHDCWRYVWDMANSSDLRKMADEMDVTNNAQAEIYVRKTGKPMEEIRGMMSDSTYMSGREAVENGFADELLDDAADPEISISSDMRTLFTRGHSMRIAAMGELPKSIKVVEPEGSVSTCGDNCVDINQPESSGNEGGTHMTLEELRQSDPEAAAALLAEAQASVSQEATATERQRMADIDAIASLFDTETVNAAKYGNPCTAQEMCYRAAQESAKQGKAFMTNLAADHEESGAESVPAAHAPEEEEKPLTAEDRKAAGKAMSKKLSGEKE